MSNQVFLLATKFKDLHDGNVCYGFRMFDDYGKTYSNLFDEDIRENILEDSFLLRLAQSETDWDDVLSEMLNFAMFEKGMIINGTQYTTDNIQEMLEG